MTNADLNGKRALVTGTASGIGASTAALMTKLGARVIGADIADDRGRALARELGPKFRYFHADVTSLKQVESLVSFVSGEFGRLDVLANVAGVAEWKGFEELTEKDWYRVIDTNLKSVIFLTKAALPLLCKSKNAVVINMGSSSAKRAGPNQICYAASKGGVESATLALANALSQYGIRVNAVAPGAIATPFNESMRRGAKGKAWKDAIASRTLLRRWGDAEDVAKVIAFLASDGAKYVTASTYAVDGGRLAAY